MNCPYCKHELTREEVAALLGSISTPAKARAARENAKLGGWPKGRKRNKARKARTQNDRISDPTHKTP